MLALYSTVTKLAYSINEQFYGAVHFVWCAPCPSMDALLPRNPPSSDPWLLYQNFQLDIRNGDHHSAIIERNRAGIIRGAESRHAQGIISDDDRDLIQYMADAAALEEFHPLFMVIPYDRVNSDGLIEQPSVKERARATSQEFVIRNLPRDHFDVWS